MSNHFMKVRNSSFLVCHTLIDQGLASTFFRYIKYMLKHIILCVTACTKSKKITIEHPQNTHKQNSEVTLDYLDFPPFVKGGDPPNDLVPSGGTGRFRFSFREIVLLSLLQ